MQVHSRKLEDTDGRRKAYKLYRWIAIAVTVVAILVAIFIAIPHSAVGSSPIAQVCFHKGAHLCYFPTM
ncbi:MAG: hypothetical protein ACREA3_02595 [Nitrosotalea sp.]